MNKYLNTLKNDIPAGLVVFLVALPLCLGIASASGASPFAGIIAGVVGGIAVTTLSKSKFGVSGPAAGLITIVVASIEKISFEGFLVAMILAGVIQYLLGHFKLGNIGYFVPHSVIKGMLASIGILLILKQFPHAMGYDSTNMGDINQGGTNMFRQILLSFRYPTYGAVIISSISLLIMLGWDSKYLKKNKFFQLIPSSVLVVTAGIVINLIFSSSLHQFKLESYHLIHLPYELTSGIQALLTGDFAVLSNSYKDLLAFPNFAILADTSLIKDVLLTAVTIAAVASIETLLSVEATDNLDPQKNLTPTNVELKAQGIGNIISGLIGGLPITQVIVRSSANISAGARSKMSALYHGAMLMLAVLLFPSLINMIPMSALAVILIVLGYKLANIKLFIQTWKEGIVQFIPFTITIICILYWDLLTGTLIGLAVSMVTILRSNYEAAYTVNEGNGRWIVSFAFVVSFLNKGALMLDLYAIPENSRVVISARKCHFISFDILELLKNYGSVVAPKRNITIEYLGFERYGIESTSENAAKRNDEKKKDSESESNA